MKEVDDPREIGCAISWGEDTLRLHSQTRSSPIKANQTKSNQIKPVAGKNGLAGGEKGQRKDEL
jgi:hypothetical protein